MSIFVNPLPRLPDGREPVVTSGAYTESRPYHNGSDILYRRLSGEPTTYPWSDGKWIIPGNVPVLAIADGTVTFTGTQSGWKGYRVTLDHGIVDGDALKSQYRHLQSLLRVREGQHVRQGQVLGFVGPMLKNALNHLHFMLNVGGAWVDPDEFVATLPIVDMPTERPRWRWLLLFATAVVSAASAAGSYYYFSRR